MKRIFGLVIFTFWVVLLAWATTFGWRLGRSPSHAVSRDPALEQELKGHVFVLSREIGDRNVFRYDELKRAADYIAGRLRSFGYEPQLQTYSVEGKDFSNIIAVKRGTQKPGEVIIVGAHYDSCLNPGADDNASGVAALLEAAHSFAKKETAKTIKFIAFVNEEPPFFQTEWTGASVYVRAAQENKEDIRAALVLEMVGYFTDKPFSQRYPPLVGVFYPNKGDFLAMVGNFPSFFLVRELSSMFRNTAFPLEPVILPAWAPGVTYSDHYAFWLAGYRAVMFTDTAFYRNPGYHSGADTYETLDYARLTNFTESFNIVLASFAGKNTLQTAR